MSYIVSIENKENLKKTMSKELIIFQIIIQIRTCKCAVTPFSLQEWLRHTTTILLQSLSVSAESGTPNMLKKYIL